MQRITSKENEFIKHVKKLKDKKYRDISNEYVGDIKDNRVIPSNDRFLVYITFIIKPNSLVIKPPISKINVDFINLFFVSVSPL